MRLMIEDGAVVCDISEPNAEFWRAVNYTFFHYSPRNIRRAKIEKTDHVYRDIYDAGTDCKALWKIIGFADMYGVEVDGDVRKHLEYLKSETERFRQKDREEEAARNRKRTWEYRCKHGCGRCENLAYYVDMPICKATKEELSEKNIPTYDSATEMHYLFHWVPFPSEKCPLKV